MGFVKEAKELDLMKKVGETDFSNFITPSQIITEEKIIKFFRALGLNCDLEETDAVAATYLLFLKGAANKGAPDSLTVFMKKKNGQLNAVTKGELLQSVQKVFENKYLRLFG